MNDRTLPLFLNGATLALLVVIGAFLAVQIGGIRADVDRASATSVESVLEEVRDLDRRVAAIDAQLDDMTARFDRLDASVAGIPRGGQEDSRIGTILSELRALQELVGGVSLDLGIVCDVVGC